MVLEKMNVKEAAEVRANLYDTVLTELDARGMSNQPVKGGALVDLGTGYFAKVSIAICDPAKVDGYIQEYAEQQAKNAERAAERAAKAEEKARKAAERAAKKAE